MATTNAGDQEAQMGKLINPGSLGSTPPAAGTPLFAAAYRPVEREGQTTLDIWFESLALNRPLPTLPLWLRGGYCVPIDFEASYLRTCSEQRIFAAA